VFKSKSITFRLLILTENDCKSSILPRVDHFYSLTGGSHCAILYVQSTVTDDSSNPHQSFQDLQYLLLTNTIDLTMHYVSDASSLPSIVKALTTPPCDSEVIKTPVPNVLTQLLPFCSITLPMSQQALTILTDLAPSMRGLSRLQTDEHVVDQMVESGVTMEEAEACVAFWRDEYLPE
jgi:hypothetical protein